MTTIDQIWLQLETEGGSEWRLRQARKDADHPLVLAIEPQHGRRALLVPVPGVSLPPRREWPISQGLEWRTLCLGSVPYWGVSLRDTTCTDVFTALAADLDGRLVQSKSPDQAARELFGRLKLWQQFLKVCREGMSLAARRGLWGELHFLHANLIPAMPVPLAVASWKAGSASHQDFQFLHAAVEVKTTAAKQPQVVRISSERQLDETGGGALFLNVIAVDEREVGVTEGINGQSLPSLVSALRKEIVHDPASLAIFNDSLFERGWLDHHAPRYESHRLTVREEIVFRVEAGFPRLVEADLPEGIGDVNYALSLPACKPFEVTADAMLSVLVASPESPKF